MKMNELIQALQEEYVIHGDLDVEVCRFTDETQRYYWASCALVRGGHFVIGYNVDSLRKEVK